MLGIEWLSGSPGFFVWLCCGPTHDRGALGCFPIPTLGHPLRTRLSFPGCGCEATHAHHCVGGGVKFTVHNSWPSSIVNK